MEASKTGGLWNTLGWIGVGMGIGGFGAYCFATLRNYLFQNRSERFYGMAAYTDFRNYLALNLASFSFQRTRQLL